MSYKKRLSPFEKLVREIEAYLVEISFNSQLALHSNTAENTEFVLGQCVALRHILEISYGIYNKRCLGTELKELSPAEFLKEFQEMTKRWDA